MTSLLKRIRYNYFASRILVLLSRPCYRMCSFAVRQIQMKVKVNGRNVKYDGIWLSFPRNIGVGFSSSIYWKGTRGFEPQTWKVIRNLVTHASRFLDIGSHFGFYSVLVQKVNQEVQTYCYEPIPALYQHNTVFHEANGANRTIIRNIGVSSGTGHQTIYFPAGREITEVRSASMEGNFFYNRGATLRKENVETTSLDDILEKEPALRQERIVLKIDVEGHEWAVMEGGEKFLADLQPPIVCEIDQTSDNLERLIALLEHREYRIYAIAKEGLFQIAFTDLERYNGSRDFLLLPGTGINGAYITFYELSNWFALRTASATKPENQFLR